MRPVASHRADISHPFAALLCGLLLAVAGPGGCSRGGGGGDSASAEGTAGGSGSGSGTALTPSDGGTTGDGNTPAPGTPAGPVTPAVCVTEGAIDQTITVTTARGPKAAAAPVPVTNALTSVNIYDQDKQAGQLTITPRFVAFLKALNPGFLRFPAGFHSQRYTFAPNGPEGQYQLTPKLLASYMDLVQKAGAKPFITVNINADPAEIAALVRYVNITSKYGVTWWEIGNEPDVRGWGGSDTPTNYANRYVAMAAAMRAVDPSIKLVGGVLLSGQDIDDLRPNCGGVNTPGNTKCSEVNWSAPMMDIIKDGMDAFSFHYYPLNAAGDGCTSSACYCTPDRKSTCMGGSIAKLLQETAVDWPPARLSYADAIIPYLRSFLGKYRAGMQVWITEFAEDPGVDASRWLGDRNVGAIWAADAVGRFADQGTEMLGKFIYKASGDHSYTLLGNDAGESLRPEYYSYWLYAQQFGDKMVAADASAIDQVAAHAAVRSSDGSLRLMLVNKTNKAQAVRVKLADFAPRSAGDYALVFTADGSPDGDILKGTGVSLNSASLTDANIGMGASAIAAAHAEHCTDNILQLKPYEVHLLIFAK